jgi:hypothetical protein
MTRFLPSEEAVDFAESGRGAAKTASRVSCICAILFICTLRRYRRAPVRSCRRLKRRSSPRRSRARKN